ncbi:hypothetical protein GF391_02500 [Candidatus Uhrbacteria bacterium]|nr:hypothetical protein [Candidatus Uhrbacteria bacterium]
MKQLDLQKSIETFAVFDLFMAALAFGGLILALLGFLLGGYWLYLAYAMILSELILIYGIFIAPKRLKTTIYREAIRPNADVWVKVVLLSDFHLHGHKSRAWMDKISSKVSAIKPDLLLIGGDIVVHNAKDAAKADPLKNIASTYGSYFVLGNHDYQDDPQAITAQLSEFGLHNLTNCNLSINIQGKELRLSGLDDAFYGRPSLPLNRASKDTPHVTLAHQPDIILNFQEDDTDLVFCGHSHGGQIRFPVIGSIRVPSAFGRKADGGRKIIKGIPTIISRGLGEVGCRARLFTPPEIVIIELGI